MSDVKPLSHLHNYRISEGDPDVRGWEVFGADGRKMGEVDDLLVDTEALKVRYLDVCFDPGLLQEQAGEPALSPQAPQAETGTAVTGAPLSATSAMGGLGPLVTETLVRATLSDEENQLTREHHHGFNIRHNTRHNTRHVLIPIGSARIDPEHDRILVQDMPAAGAAGLPDYNGEVLPPEGGFDADGLYDPDRFYGSRRQAVLPGRERS
jgi:hypothetical protein